MANFEDFSPIFCPTADFLPQGGAPLPCKIFTSGLYSIYSCCFLKIKSNVIQSVCLSLMFVTNDEKQRRRGASELHFITSKNLNIINLGEEVSIIRSFTLSICFIKLSLTMFWFRWRKTLFTLSLWLALFHVFNFIFLFRAVL